MKTRLIFLILIFTFALGFAQDEKIRWKRNTDDTPKILNLFHAIETANLPTTETLRKNEFEYEISHRFNNTVDQSDTYFGIDGPAQIRMALSYGITNNMLVTFGRSNLEDNIDIRIKYKVWKIHNETFPVAIALRGGLGWNTEVYDPVTGDKRDKLDSDNLQYYGQVIFNTMLFRNLGIGIVPAYLYNSHIYCKDVKSSFTLGSYAQYYISAMLSVFAETNTTISGWRKDHNPLTFGIEIETGGHFFKIFLTNSKALNPSQYLAGADLSVQDNDWRLGFNITRILKF